jgi:hypothetical protein
MRNNSGNENQYVDIIKLDLNVIHSEGFKSGELVTQGQDFQNEGCDLLEAVVFTMPK